jgi:hypothetical protein
MSVIGQLFINTDNTPGLYRWDGSEWDEIIGGVQGSGTQYYMPIWSGTNTLVDSLISFDPTNAEYVINAALSLEGQYIFEAYEARLDILQMQSNAEVLGGIYFAVDPSITQSLLNVAPNGSPNDPLLKLYVKYAESAYSSFLDISGSGSFNIVSSEMLSFALTPGGLLNYSNQYGSSLVYANDGSITFQNDATLFLLTSDITLDSDNGVYVNDATGSALYLNGDNSAQFTGGLNNGLFINADGSWYMPNANSSGQLSMDAGGNLLLNGSSFQIVNGVPIQLGTWPTAGRPSPASAGMCGYNTQLNVFEYYNGTIWTT